MKSRARRGTELTRHLSGLEPVVREHLKEYLEELTDPANEELMGDWLAVWFPCHGDFSFTTSRPSNYFPPELLETMRRLASSGTAEQRVGALGFYGGLTDFPDAERSAVIGALEDAAPEVLMAALNAMNVWFPLDADLTARLREMGSGSAPSDLKGQVAGVLARDPREESERWLLDTLEGARDPDLLLDLWHAYASRLANAGSGRLSVDPAFYAHGVSSALRRSSESHVWWEGLRATVRFPGDLPRRILESVAGSAEERRINDCVAAVLDLLKSGETRAAVLEDRIDEIYLAK